VFAAALAARMGTRVVNGRRSRLFVLGELVEPQGVRGRARRAGEAEVELLGRWREAFAVDVHDGPIEAAAAQEEVRRALRLGGAEIVWWADELPVSLASARPVISGMSRIGPVYTPPAHRGHGYAAAATAAASRAAIDAGAECVVLFTDVANPTTNALYPRIGYRPVCDMVELELVVG
jgi:predicted GNAT family acetyltransferase